MTDEIFTPERRDFPSSWHREIWWWNIGIHPAEVTLTPAVREKCTPEVLEGCLHWRECFLEWTRDMYQHPQRYDFATTRQHRDVLEGIAAGGVLDGDAILFTADEWRAFTAKLDKSKGFRTAGVTVEKTLNALTRAGFVLEERGGAFAVSNPRYPKLFHAMRVFEQSPSVRDTPVRTHFALCEFRQLFKSYSSTIPDLLRRASEGDLIVEDGIRQFLKQRKINRYTHFGLIKYKHRGLRVLDYALHGEDSPTLRVQMATYASGGHPAEDVFYRFFPRDDPAARQLLLRGLPECSCGGEHFEVDIGAEKPARLCANLRLRLNPEPEDLPALYQLIELRRLSIEEAVK